MPVCQYFIAHCPFLFASVQKALSKRAELEFVEKEFWFDRTYIGCQNTNTLSYKLAPIIGY